MSAAVQGVVVLAGQAPEMAELRRLRALCRRLGPALRRGGLRLLVVAGTPLDLPGAELVVGRAVRVDPADRLVTVGAAGGARHLTYDQLVVLGDGGAASGPAPTERRGAGRPDPARARARLAAWLRGLDPGAGPAIHNVVVLGGAAGSELAVALAGLLRATARRPAWQGQYLRLHLCAAPDLAPRWQARLEALGVQVRPDGPASGPPRGRLRPDLVFSPAFPCRAAPPGRATRTAGSGPAQTGGWPARRTCGPSAGRPAAVNHAPSRCCGHCWPPRNGLDGRARAAPGLNPAGAGAVGWGHVERHLGGH